MKKLVKIIFEEVNQQHVRRRQAFEPPGMRHRIVGRLDPSEVEHLIQTTCLSHNRCGLVIKALFQTSTRGDEFVHIRVEDLLQDDDTSQMHITHGKQGADCYVPILLALVDERRTHLRRRQTGFLSESNRQTRYLTRTGQSIVTACPHTAGIQKRVYPHLLRHSIVTILLDSGKVPIHQTEKCWGHLHLSPTQMYAETSLQTLSDNNIRALGGKR